MVHPHDAPTTAQFLALAMFTVADVLRAVDYDSHIADNHPAVSKEHSCIIGTKAPRSRCSSILVDPADDGCHHKSFAEHGNDECLRLDWYAANRVSDAAPNQRPTFGMCRTQDRLNLVEYSSMGMQNLRVH